MVFDSNQIPPPDPETSNNIRQNLESVGEQKEVSETKTGNTGKSLTICIWVSSLKASCFSLEYVAL